MAHLRESRPEVHRVEQSGTTASMLMVGSATDLQTILEREDQPGAVGQINSICVHESVSAG
ncbi:hypothetical protein GCM10009841_08810 [Microlunatus panaciterrae]|uniref:AsnC family protein n=1 Tax=Microlunatus panaciterrae TaxID=400768 RepID=A0ABS2RKB8_9ACTN|nr:hypothetical protein [Microlunatus panaciterrae]MBM7799427.1 hypothetical protein [Microlunatus panaciterrae]